MSTVHVAHDVRIGDHVILGNSVGLAGHVWSKTGPMWPPTAACTSSAASGATPSSDLHSHQAGRAAVLFTSNKPEVAVFGAIAWDWSAGFDKAASKLSRRRSGCSPGRSSTPPGYERIRAGSPATAEVDELIEFIGASHRGVIK